MPKTKRVGRPPEVWPLAQDVMRKYAPSDRPITLVHISRLIEIHHGRAVFHSSLWRAFKRAQSAGERLVQVPRKGYYIPSGKG